MTNNRRTAALVTVICLAQLIFCRTERQARNSFARQDKTRVEGLHAGRPAIPTSPLIPGAPATMKTIPATGPDPPLIPQPAPLQLRLPDPPGIDPRELR